MRKPKVVWDDLAGKHLRTAIQYIQKSSLQNAQKVKRDILNSTKELSDNPYKHPIDKYDSSKSKLFRAYELHHFRIAYFITDTEIRIVRIRHTSQEPRDY